MSEVIPNPNTEVANSVSTTVQPQQNTGPKSKKRKAKKVDKRGAKRQKLEEIPPELRGARPKEAPKKRVALLFGYDGKGYGGLQRNPGAKTVESELEAAIVRIGGISKENAGSFSKVGWSSCARTDKGVSAAANVISLKVILLPDLLEKLNNELPSDIRIWGVYRVGKKFSPKNKVSHRKYSYVVPTSVFRPGPRNKRQKPENFKFGPETRDAISEVLKMYVGSNCYHNFTAKSGPTTYDDPRAIRIVKSFECSAPFMIDEVEFVELTVVGQSFVLYQIRKMVGMLICIIRDGESKNIINSCFQKPKKKLPTAPAEGLFLRECLFDIYNKHCAPHDPLDWTSAREKIDNFVQKVLTPSIYSSSTAGQVFEKWLQKQDEFPLNYEELALTVEIPGKNIQKEDDEDIDGEEVPEDENQKDEEGDDDD